MATIDNLQIEISASSRLADQSIDKLINSLKRLNSNLNLDFGDKLSASLSNLNSSLSNLSDTIRDFDSAKLKDISKSFGKLNGVANMTTQANKTVSKNMRNISNEAKEAAEFLGSKFGIKSAEGVKSMQNAMSKLQDAVRNGTDVKVAESNLEKVITTFGKFDEAAEHAKEELDRLKTAMNNAGGIALPKNWSHEFTDPNRVRGNLGIGNSRLKRNAGHGEVGYDVWLEEINKQGFNFSTGIDGLEEVSNYIDKLKLRIEGANESAYKFGGGADEFRNSIGIIKEGLAQATPELEKFTQSSQQTVQGASALETIVEALRELESVNISAEKLSGIKTLADVMGKLGGKAAGGAAQSIKPIADGLRALPDTVPNGESYIQLASALAKLGGVKVTRATALNDIAKGLKAIQGVGSIPRIEGIEELAQSMSMLGRKSAQNAATVMPQLATAFKQLISTLSTAPTISRNVIDLANAMANLTANTGRSTAATRRQIPLLQNLGNTSGKVAKRTQSLSAMFGKIYATYWLLFRAFGKIRESIELAADLVEVQNVVDTVFGDAKDKVQEFADSAIQSFGMSELSAKQFASRYQAMGAAMGITNAQVVKANTFLDKSLEGSKRKLDGVADSYENLGNSLADMSINVAKLTADVGSFYNMDYEEVAEKMSSIWTGQTRPMREFGVDLTQATLQEWMLTNGIDGNIKKMTQAEKTMIRYQYVMAQLGHTMNDYARTADTWANVTRTIGEQFRKLGSIIGTGFINAFRPMLVRFRDFMNTLIGLVEKGMNAIGKLLGWQIEISEVGLADDAEYAEDLADGIGDAADNAKALNHQLQGFDKLNNLTTPSDKGGGGGSGSGATGGGGGASKATDPKVTWKKYESDIDTWWELGDTIADTLATSLENINWENIYKKAEGFGRGLAQFMNGLFADSNGTRLFEGLGTAIAGAINTVMTAADTWARYLEWGKIGDNIRAGFVSFLKEWKPEITGSAVGGIVGGLANAVYAMVSDKDTWSLLGTKISEGINAFLGTMGRVDKKTGLSGWEAIGGSIAAAFSGIGEAVKTTLLNIEWGEAFKGLWDGLKSFIDNLTVEGVIALIGVATIGKIPKLIQAALVNGINSGISALSLTIPKLIESFQLVAGGAATLHEALVVAFGGIATTIGGVISVIGGAATSILSFASMWKNGFNILKEALMLAGVAITGFGAVVLGVSASIAAPIAAIVGGVATAAILIKDHWEEITTAFTKAKEAIEHFDLNSALSNIYVSFHEFVKNIPENMKEFGTVLGATLRDGVTQAISNVSEWFAEFPDKILAALTQMRFDSNALGQKLGEWVGEAARHIVDFLHDLPEILSNVGGIIADAILIVPSIIRGIPSFLRGIFRGLKDGLRNVDWAEVGVNILKGVLSIFVMPARIAVFIVEAVAGFFDGFVKGIKRGFGIASPARNVMFLGEYILEGILVGFTSKIRDFLADVVNFKNDIVNKFNDIKDKFKTKGNNIVQGLKTGISDKWSDFKTCFAEKKQWMIDKYNDIKDRFITKGSAIVSGLKAGFNDKWSDYKTWFAEKKQWMIDKYNDIKDKFIVKGNNLVSGLKSGISEKWSDFKTWFTDKKNNLVDVYENIKDKFSTKGGLIVSGLKSGMSSKWSDFKSWVQTKRDNLADLFKIEKFESWGKNIVNGIKNGMQSIWSKLTDIAGDIADLFKVDVEVEQPKQTKKTTTTKKALGGAFYNDRWHNIAQFASGGRPSHGTAFIAGEAGAEAVGHIGGRTEVLNESQMASVMYDAVSSAMAEQNAILIKQNQYLAGILAKDYGISSSDIFSATQREASNYQLRTGRPAFGY